MDTFCLPGEGAGDTQPLSPRLFTLRGAVRPLRWVGTGKGHSPPCLPLAWTSQAAATTCSCVGSWSGQVSGLEAQPSHIGFREEGPGLGLQNTPTCSAWTENKEEAQKPVSEGWMGLLRRPQPLRQARSLLLLTFGSQVNTLYNSSGPPWLTVVWAVGHLSHCEARAGVTQPWPWDPCDYALYQQSPGSPDSQTWLETDSLLLERVPSASCGTVPSCPETHLFEEYTTWDTQGNGNSRLMSPISCFLSGYMINEVEVPVFPTT